MILFYLMNFFFHKYFSFNVNFNFNSFFINDNLDNRVHFFNMINKIK